MKSRLIVIRENKIVIHFNFIYCCNTNYCCLTGLRSK
uniref:Uncharacterized protein n=1 Tax=Tetranychus urticae TaxID=32264 RepID=T1K9C0_TETUR